MNRPGATKLDTGTESPYSVAGKQLTREAVKGLGGKCISCEETANFLLHYSLVDTSVCSIAICDSCAAKISVKELFITVMRKTFQAKQNSTIQ